MKKGRDLEPERLQAEDYLIQLADEKLPDLIRVSELAGFLGVHRSVVHSLLNGGELCGLRINSRATRVFKNSLMDYLRRRLI